MVSYTYQGTERSYTPVALDKLDVTRLQLRAKLKELSAITGDEYILRTFYLGPRPKRATRSASTLKTAAYAAKIGVYKVEKRGKYVYPSGDVRRYVNADLMNYV
jgi:hypothetical protein